MVSGDVSVACPPPYSFSRASSERAAAALSYSDLWIRIFVCSWLTSPFVPLSGYTNNTDPPQPRQPGWRGLKFANLKRGGGWQRHGCVRLSKCAFPHSPGFACSSQHFHWPSRATFGFPQYCASTCARSSCTRHANCVDSKPKTKRFGLVVRVSLGWELFGDRCIGA